MLRRLVVECFADLTQVIGMALDSRPAQACVRDLVRRQLRWVAEHTERATILYAVTLDPAVVADDAATSQMLA